MERKIYINYDNLTIKYNGLLKKVSKEDIEYLLDRDYGSLERVKHKGNDLHIEFSNMIIVILNVRNIKRFHKYSYLSYYIDNLLDKTLKR